MGQHVTIDIVDRPAAGVLGTRRAIKRVSAAHGVPALMFTTTRFSASYLPSPFTPRRLGLVAVWESREKAEARWRDIVGPQTRGLEHWHVLGEVTRADTTAAFGPWQPDATGSTRVAGQEPALVLIKGNFANSHWLDFLRAALRAGGQLDGTPGYLGGVGLVRPVFEMTSLSCWATMKHARAYAYAAGAHADIMKRSLDEEWSRVNAFMTIRPIEVTGTLDGVSPFAGLLPEPRETATP